MRLPTLECLPCLTTPGGPCAQTSRLYTKKLEALLADETNMLHRCAFCTRLFTPAQREWEPCPRAPPLLDFHGNRIAEHVPNRSWDVTRWVSSLRRAKGGAREAFWRLWGLTHFLTCSTCDHNFPICELDHCAYHPQEPVFDRGDHRGYFPCCHQPVTRFEPPSERRRGCCFRRHTPVLRPPLGAPDGVNRSAMRVVDAALAHTELVLSSTDASDNTGGGWGSLQAHLSGGEKKGSAGWKSALAAAANAAADADDDDDADLRPLVTSVREGGKSAGKGRKKVKRGGSARTRTTSSTVGGGHQAPIYDGNSSDGGDRISDVASDVSYSDSDSSAGSLSDSDTDPLEMHARKAAEAVAGRNAGRGRGGVQAGSGWQLESLMIQDEQAMNAMSRVLEGMRAEPPPTDKPPALMGSRAFFLDRRQIMHIGRGSNGGVLWPRSAAAAAKRS